MLAVTGTQATAPCYTARPYAMFTRYARRRYLCLYAIIEPPLRRRYAYDIADSFAMPAYAMLFAADIALCHDYDTPFRCRRRQRCAALHATFHTRALYAAYADAIRLIRRFRCLRRLIMPFTLLIISPCAFRQMP